MAEHDWPSSVPTFLVDGYARGGGDDGVIRSQFPGGVKQRPRFTTAPPEQVTATVLCNKAQLQTLLDFYNITLRRVSRFNLRDHTKPDTTTVEYRFTGRPSYQPAGSGFLYRVTLPLEQMNTFQGTFPVSDGNGNLLSDGDGQTLTT